MNILLIYPEFPDTFWSYKHALRFIGKKAALPPLGLLTVAGLLPDAWGQRVVDLNVTRLRNKDLAWADYAFIGAMAVQKDSAKKVIARCRAAGLTIVAGGPLFSMEPDAFEDVDHLVLNEAEITLPMFLDDLAAHEPKRVYTTDAFADMKDTPAPRWDLVDLRRYHSMSLQYSRGCPFNCDFCNITSLLGHRVRTKTTDQVIAELDGLYRAGWRGAVFFVDDNFIGNKRKLQDDLLPRLIAWREGKQQLTFNTEASIDLADDPGLMAMMVEAGFDTVFIGIETPDELSLSECNKKQNTHRDLVEDVKRIQRAGLQVQGGFIVGFDSDEPSVFDRQIEFIQKSGIVTAMVGLLQAPLGTKLYKRLHDQGRILDSGTGDNVEGSTNIVPAMDLDLLKRGYRGILDYIYAPKHYYRRIRTFLREFRAPERRRPPRWREMMAFVKSIFRLGILGRERLQYWGLILWTCFRRPRLFPLAMNLAITGYHFRTVCEMRVR